jgi:hypothetical protein
MSWDGNCDDCRTLATTWAIFLAIALVGALAVRWRRWALAPVLLFWFLAARDQVGYFGAGMDRGLLWHAVAAICTGLVAPVLTALVLRRRAQGSSSELAA